MVKKNTASCKRIPSPFDKLPPVISNKKNNPRKEAPIAKSKLPSKDSKSKSKKVKVKHSKPASPEIVIDKEAGLIFKSESQLFEFFEPQVSTLENELNTNRKAEDFTELEVEDIENELDLTLEEPAEIWYDELTFKEYPVFHFVRPLEKYQAFHIACSYVSSEDEPTFVFLHFVTRDLELVDRFRRGDLVYDRAFEEVGFGMLDGDALSEGDPLAMGLFLAMLKVRGDKDVPFDQFKALGTELREETIEGADEIWRSSDMKGNTLVTFIKDFPDHELRDLYYIGITQEDSNSGTHSLLFSFPTVDESLVDRYRHGENLQADEVTQESSH